VPLTQRRSELPAAAACIRRPLESAAHPARRVTGSTGRAAAAPARPAMPPRVRHPVASSTRRCTDRCRARAQARVSGMVAPPSTATLAASACGRARLALRTATGNSRRLHWRSACVYVCEVCKCVCMYVCACICVCMCMYMCVLACVCTARTPCTPRADSLGGATRRRHMWKRAPARTAPQQARIRAPGSSHTNEPA
jgi:hypothetical protein